MINRPALQLERNAPFNVAMIDGEFDELEPLELQGITVQPAQAEHLRHVPLSVDGCSFVGCDLSLFTFVSVRRSLFSNSKLRGTRFTRSMLTVVFDDCLLHECGFRMISMKATCFDASTLVDCDFYGSTIDSVSFPQSTINGVGFDNCTINGLDLTSAADLLIGDPRTLIGATIDESHVPLIALRLAQLTGINVVES